MAADPGVTYDAPPRHEQIFRAEEFSIEGFGTLSVGQDILHQDFANHGFRKVREDGRAGWGLGANYFFIRNLGLAVEGYTENAGHSFVDDASASIVFRIPFDGVHLAPYVFVGGGHQFDPITHNFGHGGVGLEWRFVKNAGIFIDGRYVVSGDNDKANNFGLGRLGLRFSF
jgi:hypothetical protein